MNIKQFLLVFFLIFFCLAIFINILFFKGIEVETNTNPIQNYVITKIHCYTYSPASRLRSSIDIFYNKKDYNIAVNDSICASLKTGNTLNKKLYYSKQRDVVFCEGNYNHYKFIYAAYIFSITLPLFGFIVYRKELNNHYKTM